MNSKTDLEKQQQDYLRQNVGIDVGKDDLKVCLSGMTRDLEIVILVQQVYSNDKKGWTALSKLLSKQSKQEENPVHCTMEATGVYYEGLAHHLHAQKFTVHVVLANQSKSYGKSLGLKSKTDKIDARTLSQMGLERTLREWTPPGPVLINLKQLTRERERLINMQTVLKNNLHSCEHRACPRASTLHRTNDIVSFIKEQIKAIDREIVSEIQKDEEIKRKLPYILSIPGVGVLTAATVISETKGFADTVNIKQLASYCGLDIRIAESGTWKGQSRISKKGNSHLRHALYMPTLSKIRFDTSTKEHYEKLKARTCPMKAVTAECRKLLCLMYSLWTKEEMYCPDYRNNKNKSVKQETSVLSQGSVEIKEQKNESNDVDETVMEDVALYTKSGNQTVSEDIPLVCKKTKVRCCKIQKFILSSDQENCKKVADNIAAQGIFLPVPNNKKVLLLPMSN